MNGKFHGFIAPKKMATKGSFLDTYCKADTVYPGLVCLLVHT